MNYLNDIRFTTDSTHYSRLHRSSASNQFTQYNTVIQPGGGETTGYSLGFNGSNQYATGTVSQLTGSTQYTVSFWLYITALDTSAIQTAINLSAGTGSNDRRIDITTSGSIIFSDGGTSIVTGAAGTISTGTWYHIAFREKSGTASLWLNGTSLGSATYSEVGLNNSTVSVGRRYSSGSYQYYTHGNIDLIRIYNSALSDADISTLSTGGIPATAATSIWKMTEGTGTSVADTSVNGNNLTLSGTPTWSTSVPSYINIATLSVFEATVIQSQDGGTSGEKGIHTFGDLGGKAIIQGGTTVAVTCGGTNSIIATPSLLSLGSSITASGVNTNLLALQVPTGLTVVPNGTTSSFTYAYRVAAVNSQGVTIACAEVSTTSGNITLSGTNYNAISWNPVSGATSYKVYGRSAGSELFMANVSAPTITYNDTGAVSPSGALPGNPAGTKMVVQAWNGQTGNLQEWQSSATTVKCGVNNVGDMFMASTSGPPSDTPVANSVRFDAATNKLWIYNGSAWKSTTLT